MRQRRVLIIDSSPGIRDLLSLSLARDFEVAAVGTLALAQAAFRDPNHDVFVVDVALSVGGAEGLELICQARAEGDTRPIVAVSGLREPRLPKRCYDAGADGFIAKPFRTVSELSSLIARLLSRAPSAPLPPRIDGMLLPTAPFRFAGATIDASSMAAVFANGATVSLTPKEIGLLHFLAGQAGHLVLRSEIMARVWGPLLPSTSKTVDTHLVRLRKAYASHGADLSCYLKVKAKVGWWISERANE